MENANKILQHKHIHCGQKVEKRKRENEIEGESESESKRTARINPLFLPFDRCTSHVPFYRLIFNEKR